jgi:hypothetical protein
LLATKDKDKKFKDKTLSKLA